MVLAFSFGFTGILKTIFYDTWLSFKLLGLPAAPNRPDLSPGFTLTLIDIIILVLVAFLVSYISEKLTGKKLGGMLKATVITLIGSWLALAFVNLPPGPMRDFAIEDVVIIPALLGAIIVAVFYTLIRAQFQKK